jgi:hypothetical protein
MPVQLATLKLATLQLATLQLVTFQLATLTTRHSDTSTLGQLATLTTRHLTTRHPDNSPPLQLVTITTRHHGVYAWISLSILIIFASMFAPYNAPRIFHSIFCRFFF